MTEESAVHHIGTADGYWLRRASVSACGPRTRMEARNAHDEQGRKHGRWETVHEHRSALPDGPTIETRTGEYSHGVAVGEWRYVQSNGHTVHSTRTVTHDLGDRHGPYRAEDGTTVTVGHYDRGLMHGRWSVVHSGEPWASGRCEHGRKVGLWTENRSILEPR